MQLTFGAHLRKCYMIFCWTEIYEYKLDKAKQSSMQVKPCIMVATTIVAQIYVKNIFM